MKTRNMLMGLMLFASLSLAFTGCSKSPVVDEQLFEKSATLSSITDFPTLISGEDAGIIQMREEEKLARDVYNYLAVQWGMPVFSNIASSEQTHMDSIVTLIDQYGLTDPASDQSGVFTNQSLQDLYSSLIAQGSISIEEAFKVGAAIEEIDILDLQNRLLLTAHPDIQLVFENLLNGSYNHLNAFATNLFNRTGSTYVPQYLSSEAYQTIISNGGTTGSGGGRYGWLWNRRRRKRNSLIYK